MDASWLALAVAGISTVPGALVWLGARADRRAKQRDVVVGGYDRLVEDLEAENNRLRRDLAESRAEADQLRADRRPKPHRAGGGGR